MRRSRRHWRDRLRTVRHGSSVVVLAVLTSSIWLASPASAATYTVTNTDDSGPGSLRQAIADANAALGTDMIDFAVTGTIALTSGQLTVTDDLTIDGPGATSLTISGTNASRVLELGPGKTLSMDGLTVANGSSDLGGGIRNNGGTLIVTNSTISGNSAAAGGGMRNDGGTVTIVNGVVSGNSAGFGGGIESNFGSMSITNSVVSGNSGGFGAIHNRGALTVTQSTFSGNSTHGIMNRGSLVLTDSTFFGNSSPSDGGGIMNDGGSLSVTNSTFSGNSAGAFGGGIANFGGAGSATITNATFSGNSAGQGGGIHRGNGTVTLQNTIVTGSPSGGNCSGTINDGGGNLSWPDASCPGINQDPMLGPLQNNGGPTETMALQAGSPAIDNAVLVTCPATDQRGVSRPQGAGCDIGSFELEAAVYTFEGFFAPIDNPPVINKAKAGQIIAVKWRLTDPDGMPVDDPASFVSLTSGSTTCDPNDPTDAIETYAGGSGLQYLGDGNWQFNWSTPKGYAGKCKVMMLNLADGSTHTALFQFM